MQHSSDGLCSVALAVGFLERRIFVRHVVKFITLCNVMRHVIVNTLKKEMQLWQVMTIE